MDGNKCSDLLSFFLRLKGFICCQFVKDVCFILTFLYYWNASLPKVWLKRNHWRMSTLSYLHTALKQSVFRYWFLRTANKQPLYVDLSLYPWLCELWPALLNPCFRRGHCFIWAYWTPNRNQPPLNRTYLSLLFWGDKRTQQLMPEFGQWQVWFWGLKGVW